MTLSTKQRSMLIGVGVFLLPLVMFKLVAMIVGAPVPAQADAGPSAPAAGPAAMSKPITWSDDSIAAAEYVASIRTETFGPSPMYYPLPRPVGPPVETPVTPVDTGTDRLAFHGRVTSILSSAAGDMVIVDGRLLRIGQAAPGSAWILDSIDVVNRQVVFRHEPSGETVTRDVKPN